MNAYELLELKDLENNSEQKIDILVRTRANNNMDYLIKRLNQMLEMDFTILEKLDFVNEILEQLTYYATACDCIESEEARKKYKEMGMPDVEAMADQKKRDFFDVNMLIPNDKSQLVNAYQMLKMRKQEIKISPEKEDKEKDKEKKEEEDTIEIKDEYVRSKTLNTIKFSLSSSELSSIENKEKVTIQLLRYMWAYSKIDTREKRLAYTYRLMAREGNKKYGKIMPVKKDSDEFSRISRITDLGENGEDYASVEVCETNTTLNYEGVTPDDSIIAREYLITKYKPDGRNVSYAIYSSIDIDRLNSDNKYGRQVSKMLTDEKIALGTRFLGGYVGEIVNGQLKLSTQKIAICTNFANKERKEKRQQEHTDRETPSNNQLKIIRPNQSNPDPDDNLDI